MMINESSTRYFSTIVIRDIEKQNLKKELKVARKNKEKKEVLKLKKLRASKYNFNF